MLFPLASPGWSLSSSILGEIFQEQMVLLEKKSATYSQVWQGSGVASLLFYSDPRGPSREARDFFWSWIFLNQASNPCPLQ